MRQLFFILIFGLYISINAEAQQSIENSGDIIQVLLPLSGIGIAIAKGDKKGSLQLVKSFALETLLVTAIKYGVDRKRPISGHHSFPSGHTALAFMGSTFIYKRYGWKYGLPATLAAAFVGFSRFGTDEPRHFFSDVLAGALIGIGSSLLFTDRHQPDINIQMIGSTSYVGVNVRWMISQ